MKSICEHHRSVHSRFLLPGGCPAFLMEPGRKECCCCCLKTTAWKGGKFVTRCRKACNQIKLLETIKSDNMNTHQGGPALLLCHPHCASPLGDVIKIIFSVLAMVHPLHTAKNPISLFLVTTEPVFRAIQSNRGGKRVPGISLTLLSFKLRARQCRPELITNSNYTLCLGDIDDIFNFKFMHLQLHFFFLHCSNKARKALKHMPIFSLPAVPLT